MGARGRGGGRQANRNIVPRGILRILEKKNLCPLSVDRCWSFFCFQWGEASSFFRFFDTGFGHVTKLTTPPPPPPPPKRNQYLPTFRNRHQAKFVPSDAVFFAVPCRQRVFHSLNGLRRPGVAAPETIEKSKNRKKKNRKIEKSKKSRNCRRAWPSPSLSHSVGDGGV